jgi:hypothetical protein
VSEPLFLLVMLWLHVALGWAGTRAYYRGRLAELVEEEVERVIQEHHKAVDEYGQACLRVGREQGANEMASKAVRVGLRLN